jgi:hypothetical protein
MPWKWKDSTSEILNCWRNILLGSMRANGRRRKNCGGGIRDWSGDPVSGVVGELINSDGGNVLILLQARLFQPSLLPSWSRKGSLAI